VFIVRSASSIGQRGPLQLWCSPDTGHGEQTLGQRGVRSLGSLSMLRGATADPFEDARDVDDHERLAGGSHRPALRGSGGRPGFSPRRECLGQEGEQADGLFGREVG
jgi:hypothetical protein